MRCSLTPQFWAAAGGGALTAKRPATTARAPKKTENLGIRIVRLLGLDGCLLGRSMSV
jgi:hypothetical protein